MTIKLALLWTVLGCIINATILYMISGASIALMSPILLIMMGWNYILLRLLPGTK